MFIVRFQFVILLMLGSLFAGISPLFAQAASPAFVEGQHYTRLAAPARTANPNKIEVLSVFWYGSPQCYSFDALIQRWRAGFLTANPDVRLVHSPAVWNDTTKTHAQIYYTGQSLGVEGAMRGEIFDALHRQGRRLVAAADIKPLFTRHGLDSAQFESTFNSFTIVSNVNRAQARMRTHGISGTPELVIDGTYRTSAAMAGSQQRMLAVAEHLVAKVRQDRAR